VSRNPFAIYAITRHGVPTAQKLVAELSGAELFVSERLHAQAPAARAIPLPMSPLLADTFAAYDCHVFVISVGAVVRMIAPLIASKKTDPAVVCIDDAARFAICVLSGHVGRGNVWTDRIATILGAQSVVTTASDAIGTLTVDILGRELGWTLDDPDRNVTRGCAAVVNAEPVLFVQETGEPSFWPVEQPLPEGVRYATSLDGVDPAAHAMLLIATDRDLARTHPRHFERAVVYRPKSLVLGVGCDRDTDPALVQRGVAALLAEHGLSDRCVRAIATIDKKLDEPAILQLATRFGCELVSYTAEQLDAAAGIETPSDIVKRHVGTRGVAEPAALLCTGTGQLLLSKQIYSEPGSQRSMTLAVARVPFPRRKEAES
jgi:cobalt-precorrin 5A hydrolase